MRREYSVGMRIGFAVLGGVLLVSATTLNGCGGENSQKAPTGAATQEPIIPEKDLPLGWKMMLSSDMPPIDRMPWWRQNPQVLEGNGTKVLDIQGRPTSASRVLAVMYENAYRRQRVALFFYKHSTAREADEEYRLMMTDFNAEAGVLGFSIRDRTTVVFMGIRSDSPDREFFLRYFWTIACPAEDLGVTTHPKRHEGD